MGLHDRTYWEGEQDGGRGMRGGGFGGMPKPPPAVKWLLIANLVLFFAGLFRPVHAWLAVVPARWWELWRFVTFQFLHGGPMHLVFNMIALYFLGTILERSWGTRRFVRFYLICGVVAGLCHVALTAARGGNMGTPLIGASGGVYAVVIAGAILFPQIRVFVFLFPLPIRVAALLFVGVAVYGILDPRSGGISHAAHLGGAAAGAFWIWMLPKIQESTHEARARHGEGAWKRKIERKAEEQAEVDRILDKIRQRGIQSLSNREKRTLQTATRKQRED